MKYFLVYITAVSILSSAICIFDKSRAVHGGRRISERTLFRLSLAGGAAAMYITMLLIRHKTRHKRFMIGIPLIILLHLLIFFMLLLTNR